MSDENQQQGDQQEQGDQQQNNQQQDDKTPKARADGKPLWLPEKFKSEEDLAVSYKALETQQFKRRDDVKAELVREQTEAAQKDVPASPLDYKFEPVKMKDGKELQLDEKDPLVGWFQTTAHAMKLPQATYQKLVSEFVQADMQRGPKWDEESKELGEAAELRLGRVEGWMRGNAPQEIYDAFARIPATAATIKMFEHIMTLAGEPVFTPSETPAGFTEGVTKESLQAMQKDPRYWKAKDPVFIRQVQAGFRKLANGGR